MSLIYDGAWKIFMEICTEDDNLKTLSKDDLNAYYASDAFRKKAEAYFEVIAATSLKKLEESLEGKDEKLIEDEAWNRDLIAEVWGVGFSWYRAYMETCLQFCDEYDEYIRRNHTINEQTEGLSVFTVLRYLNGRAIHIAREVLILTENGFADAAYARHRTLYELFVIGSFIERYGDEVAKSFIDYGGDKYHWAAFAFPARKPASLRFIDIESNSGLSGETIPLWRMEYKLTSKLIHASSQGTFSRLGQAKGTALFSLDLPILVLLNQRKTLCRHYSI